MKQLVVLAGCAVFLVALTGCQKADNTERVIIEGAQNAGSAVQVTIQGDGKFPKFLVGTWKENKLAWEFVFERDGTISSAVIDAGMVRVNPGKKVATVELKEGAKGTYKLGQWTVQYSPHSRELAVEVVVDYFHLDMKTFGLKGHSTDWFVGPVSQDAKTWEAEWYTWRTNIFLTPERTELRHDPNDNPIETLIFKKQQTTN